MSPKNDILTRERLLGELEGGLPKNIRCSETSPNMGSNLRFDAALDAFVMYNQKIIEQIHRIYLDAAPIIYYIEDKEEYQRSDLPNIFSIG